MLFLHAHRHHILVSTDLLMLPIGGWGAYAYRYPFIRIVIVNRLPIGSCFSPIKVDFACAYRHRYFIHIHLLEAAYRQLIKHLPIGSN